MCFGSRPEPPQVVYQGPSKEDIARQEAAMESYRQQAAQQQKLLADQLQQQIDEANSRLVEEKMRLSDEQALAARSADQSNRELGSYAVQASRESPPAASAAKTTSAPKVKERPRTGLKIAPGATAASAGTGLNIGV